MTDPDEAGGLGGVISTCSISTATRGKEREVEIRCVEHDSDVSYAAFFFSEVCLQSTSRKRLSSFDRSTEFKIPRMAFEALWHAPGYSRVYLLTRF